jgi:hypothetical protein
MKKAPIKPKAKSLLKKTSAKNEVDLGNLSDNDMVMARLMTKQEMRMVRNYMKRKGGDFSSAVFKLGIFE